MSIKNGKACCNCKHCIRVKNPEGCITLHCMVDDGRYIGYLHGLESQERWCRHWARDRISGIDPDPDTISRKQANDALKHDATVLGITPSPSRPHGQWIRHHEITDGNDHNRLYV